jgi:uncharacterized protein YbjT (DUF2867 family)
MYLITGAAWASGRVSDSVVELLRGKREPVRVMVRRDDGRASRFCELGAEVVVADLTSPVDVVEAMRDVTRTFFNTRISFDYLQEVAIAIVGERAARRRLRRVCATHTRSLLPCRHSQHLQRPLQL